MLGYASGLWTTSRVRELIEDQCVVHYHEDHVWRMPRRLGWSCQRPTRRTLEWDPHKARIIAIGIDDAAIIETLRFIRGNGLELPFKSGCFDYVVAVAQADVRSRAR